MGFTVSIIAGPGYEWDEPPVEFAERAAALDYVRGLMGQLCLDAPCDTMAVVTDGSGAAIATYSVASWRVAVKLIGKKAYGT
jgi:hypothetical protein